MFKKAERKKAKLRLALSGPSGSGKTYSSLLLAKGLGGQIAFIDTERGSASLYSHLVDFDVLELNPPYAPERFIAAMNEAEKLGYSTIIIDSMTHEWSGAGGCLQINEEIAKSRFKGNTWSAWNETTPRHQAFIDRINSVNAHVICCMRSKTETTQQENGYGKKQVVKLGMKDEQRDGSEYEFTIKLDLVHDGHFAIATKDRTRVFKVDEPKPITEETGALLLNWLESGVEEQEPSAKQEQPTPDYANQLLNAIDMQALIKSWNAIPKGLRTPELMQVRKTMEAKFSEVA